MNTLYAFILSLIAGLSTVIGSLLVFIKIKDIYINKFIAFILSFSASIMIFISVIDLLPSSLIKVLNNYQIMSTIVILILFIISYKLIKFIKYRINNTNSLYKLGILSMITLIIHNLPEGIITFLSSMINIKIGIKLSIAIALHNIPEGIIIAIPLYYATKSKKKAILMATLSGLSEFIGALISYLFLYKFINNNIIDLIMIFVAFLMIILAIEEMYPESLKYKENKYTLLGLLTGFIIVILSIII